MRTSHLLNRAGSTIWAGFDLYMALYRKISRFHPAWGLSFTPA
ncbi:MAG: hypothetical protein O7D35_04100 [Acidobacteria bacterium]|nr:hypothetical protein [Acidobacteriota bacterium]